MAHLTRILGILLLLAYFAGFWLRSEAERPWRLADLIRGKPGPQLVAAGGEQLAVVPLSGREALAFALRKGALVRACFVPAPADPKTRSDAECLGPLAIVEAHPPGAGKDDGWIALSLAEAEARGIGRFLAAETRYLLLAAPRAAAKHSGQSAAAAAQARD